MFECASSRRAHEVKAYGAHIQLVHDGEHCYDLVDALIAHRVPGLYMVMQAVRHRLNNYGAYAVVHEAGVNALQCARQGGIELRVLRQAYRAVLHAHWRPNSQVASGVERK